MTDSTHAHVHHAIDYIELYAGNLAANRRFYEQAFGWEFHSYGPDYLGIRRAGGGEVGGMTSTCEVKRGGALVILYSNDIEASAEAVRAAGGEVVKEIFAFPGGRRFHFTDPAGNELAVWTDSGGLSLGEG